MKKKENQTNQSIDLFKDLFDISTGRKSSRCAYVKKNDCHGYEI